MRHSFTTPTTALRWYPSVDGVVRPMGNLASNLIARQEKPR